MTSRTELKRAAEAATDGAWHSSGSTVWAEDVEYGIEPDCCGQFNRDGSCCGNAVPRQTEELVQREIASADGVDAHFIALANPETVLGLLSELDEARAQLAEAREALEPFAKMAKPIEEALDIGPYVFDGFYFSPPHPELKHSVRVRLGDLRRAKAVGEKG